MALRAVGACADAGLEKLQKQFEYYRNRLDGVSGEAYTARVDLAVRLQKAALEVEQSVKEIMAEQGMTNEMVDMYRVVFSMLDLDDGGIAKLK